jgi:hypothetical protein
MITTRNTGYWATGISVRWHEHSGSHDGVPHGGWSAKVDFLDDGFCNDDADAAQISTEGTLRTRYSVRDGNRVSGLRAAIDALLLDIKRLGIEMRGSDASPPSIYYHGDGEDPEWPPPVGWRELLAAEAERIGWTSYVEVAP